MESHQIAIVVVKSTELAFNLEDCEIRIVNKKDWEEQSDISDMKTYYTYPIRNPHIQRVGNG